MATPQRVFSGIQPTAVMTIGNYFGAVKNWVRLQDECEAVYCVVDLHAMTVAYDPRELRRSTKDMFAALLACGVDPERATVFVQSTVPEHTELCWVLATLASAGDLGRMTQFKEKSSLLRGGEGGGRRNGRAGGRTGDDDGPRSRRRDDGGGSSHDDGSFVPAGLLFYPVLQRRTSWPTGPTACRWAATSPSTSR